MLRRILLFPEGQDLQGLGDLLSDYAAALEEARRLLEADAVVTLRKFWIDELPEDRLALLVNKLLANDSIEQAV